MITIKSHFAFSGINIPSTINCSINSYFKDDQLIQQIDSPTILCNKTIKPILIYQ